MNICKSLVVGLFVVALVTHAVGGEPDTRTRSPVIKNLVIEPQRISIGNGDNWPITWGDDGDQYTVYCDGKGFGGRAAGPQP